VIGVEERAMMIKELHSIATSLLAKIGAVLLFQGIELGLVVTSSYQLVANYSLNVIE